jgi:quercetin dioxygenase-like cupin family protein
MTALQEAMDALVAELGMLNPEDRAARIAEVVASLDGANGATVPSDAAASARQPLLLCDWATDAGTEGQVQRLEIDMTPGPIAVLKTKAATGRSLVSNGYLGADLLHVPAGQGFAPHTHKGDHLLFVVGGRGTITVAGRITPTSAGQVYMIEGAVPHAVGAVTDHVILAVGAPHRPLDSEDRQNLTEYAALLTRFGSITCTICAVTANSGDELEMLGCAHSPHQFS